MDDGSVRRGSTQSTHISKQTATVDKLARLGKRNGALRDTVANAVDMAQAMRVQLSSS